MLAGSRCALSNASTQLSHLRIRRTFPVENGSPMDGIRGFDRRHENGLNTFRINGHGIYSRKGAHPSSHESHYVVRSTDK